MVENCLNKGPNAFGPLFKQIELYCIILSFLLSFVLKGKEQSMSPALISERYSRPVKPLTERSRLHKDKQSFALTSEGICKFIRDNTKTTEETLKFLHTLGCTWDENGNLTVHPI